VHTFNLDERTQLRLPEESDAEELYAVISANRAYLSQWMPWAPGQTLDGTLEFIRTSRKQVADNQGFQTFIVQDGAIVGVLGFHSIDWGNRSTTIGYWIAERAQGSGTVTRAVTALTEHAFSVWRLNRVEIRAGVGNARSRAIPRRLGFADEGVSRQSERLGDRYVDHAVYSMLAQDWPGASRVPSRLASNASRQPGEQK
jgi:ribosomal-protein-serine acetyltransferase